MRITAQKFIIGEFEDSEKDENFSQISWFGGNLNFSEAFKMGRDLSFTSKFLKN